MAVQTGRIASNPSAVAPIRVAVIVGSAIFILGVGLIGGLLFTVGCSENLFPGTDRERICNSIGETPQWHLLVLAPLFALSLTQAFAWFRRRAWLAALAILLVTVLGWTYLLLIASSNIGDTTGSPTY